VEAHVALGERENNSGNHGKAFGIFSEAADRGNNQAMFNLWEMYQKGQVPAEGWKGKEKGGERERPVQLLTLAASKGLPEAQVQLARLYEEGEGGLGRDEGKAR
jgi:TPR repeat protein